MPSKVELYVMTCSGSSQSIDPVRGKALTEAKMDEMLVRFLDAIIKVLLQAIVVITALGQLGVKITSMIAILGAAGLAVGFSLQNSLSNFAAGVLPESAAVLRL